MFDYEREKSNSHEDNKMNQIADNLKKKEHDQEIATLKTKISIIEASKKQAAEDLKQAKVQVLDL